MDKQKIINKNMKKKKEIFREYKIVKISRNDKFYWKPMYRDKKICKKWNNLGILVQDTDYLIPAEYEYKFGAIRRISKDIKYTKSFDYGKYEVFEEIPIRKIKLT